MTTNENTFSVASVFYAIARPQYPADLFRWIAGQCENVEMAWDCATGNGQAAIGLANYFDHVDATDISSEQMAHARPHRRVHYAVASAEASGLPDSAYDLVAVAQALHWFRFAEFWPEVHRVAKRNAFFCAWGYDWPECTHAVFLALAEMIRAIVEPYWAPNNRIVFDGYRFVDVCFPFDRITTPSFAIEVHWTMDQFIDYLMTWSAFKRSCADAGVGAAIEDIFRHARSLVSPGEINLVRMPLKVLAGRIV
jgi:ubiquinone/menaquinone biosynthesis C-methylase UbiE